MNGNQSKYVLFDQDLIQKWGALDFLGCINANGTSLQYAIQQGKAQSPPQPYALGTSACEQGHDPEYAAVPLSVFQSGSTQTSINDYCSITSCERALRQHLPDNWQHALEPERLHRAPLPVDAAGPERGAAVVSTPTAQG